MIIAAHVLKAVERNVRVFWRIDAAMVALRGYFQSHSKLEGVSQLVAVFV